MKATHINSKQARELVPGIGGSVLQENVDHAALLLQGGLVLDSKSYLRSCPVKAD